MTLEQLRILAKVVESGSFTRAAELLSTQKSHVSRVVAQLETELGARLLERTTRSVAMTEMGREVHERAVGILAAVDDTARMVASSLAEPRGLLRLTCGVEFGLLAVGRWVEAFVSRHPQVNAEVEYTSRVLDVAHEGFDLAIRVGPVQDGRLVARRLGELEYGLFACPRYLERHGRPRTPAQLRDHARVMFSSGGKPHAWTMVRDGRNGRETERVEGPARLRVNNALAVRDALLRSLGLGVLPLLVAEEGLASGRLVPVLPAWQFERVPVHALYPSSRYLSPKVRAFVDLALERFPADSELARRAVVAARPGAVRRSAPAGAGRA
ncbi:MAG: LysR family transcriptional regulator [Burkholderiales bacterium]|jgi:DNA-binding transcriptional LysR family regulator